MQNGGGRPGIIYHVNDVSVYQVAGQRGGGVPDGKDAFRARVLRLEPRAIRFSSCKRLKLQRLGQKLVRSLEGGPLLPLSTLVDTDVIHVIGIYRDHHM